jgi:DNA-directed RNA polymerase subunit F
MIRRIAIGLAAATIAITGSTLSVSALQGQESGISKESMNQSVKSHRFGPRTYGFYGEERGRGKVAGYKPDRFDEISRFDRGDRISRLTPLQRERLKGIAHERLAELTPRQRADLRRITGQLADRERLRAITGGRYAELTWRQRARLSRIARQLADLTPLQRERLRVIMRERYEQFSPVERERYRQGPYGRR